MNFNELLEPLNRLARSFVKIGLGGPCLSPIGLVVLENTGRTSGVVREVPLLAYRMHRFLVVGTARARSQWLRNLDAERVAAVWVGGQRRRCKAKDPLSEAPDAVHRRIANATRAMFGPEFDFRILELQPARSVGETMTPLASA